MLEEETDSDKVKELKQNIFDIFEDLSSYGEFGDKFNDFDENFEVMYYTAMFFFNYLIEQKDINKGQTSLIMILSLKSSEINRWIRLCWQYCSL